MRVFPALFCLLAALQCQAQTPAHERALARFKSSAEPAARDAIWTTPAIFKVGVVDNGTPRSGYAAYVCSTLAEFGFAGRGVWVQIIDIAKLQRTGEWVKLGESRCK